MCTPRKESASGQGWREVGTVAAPLGGDAKDTEFLTDKRGRPILDAAGLEVLKAWRYFSTVPGDVPAIVVALLVIAWAMLRGRT